MCLRVWCRVGPLCGSSDAASSLQIRIFVSGFPQILEGCWSNKINKTSEQQFQIAS
jgi:hypothetical protein